MNNYDPQACGVQYLEDLSTAYWNSQVLFTAIELHLFDFLYEKQKSLEEIIEYYKCNKISMERYLDTLQILGLIEKYDKYYYNSTISNNYLVQESEMYQGNSILWRKELMENWKDLKSNIIHGKRLHYIEDNDENSIYERTKNYISAMDSIAKYKAKEIVEIFEGISLAGSVLDIGSGSGAFSIEFIEKYPGMKATLFDLENVIKITKENLSQHKGLIFHQGNILEKWDLKNDKYDLIIMSNILHAYSEKEVLHLLNEANKYISNDGFIVIHDFFTEHYPQKARLSDLNMMINTFNGKVFNAKWVCEKLREYNLYEKGLLPLETDTGLILASKNRSKLEEINWNKNKLLMNKINNLGLQTKLIQTNEIYLTESARIKCEYGCKFFGKGSCPPNSLSIDKTAKILNEFKYALLIQGEPSTKDFQKKILQAETLAYKEGFYKSFVFWAGPCSLCDECNSEGTCNRARPSMEGSGIDVFETVRSQGKILKTVSKHEYVKYFGLLLLE